MTVMNAPPNPIADPPESAAPAPGDDGRPVVVMIVANAFCRDDGWHDIRVHKFAKTFQEQGLRPIVFCRTHGDARRDRGVYDGIEYRRMLFRAPRPRVPLPAQPVEVASVPHEPGGPSAAGAAPDGAAPVDAPINAPAARQPNAIERLIARIDPGPSAETDRACAPSARPAEGPRGGPDRSRRQRLAGIVRRFRRNPVRTSQRLLRVLACKGLLLSWRVARRLKASARRALRLVRRLRNRGRTLARRSRTVARRAVNWGRVRARRTRAAFRRLLGIPPRARRRFNTTYLNFLNIDFTDAVLRATGEETPAFVYAADLNCLRAGYRVSRRAGVPFLYDSHEYFLSRAEHQWMHWSRRVVDRWLCRRLERTHFPKIETTIGVSQSIVDAFKERSPNGSYLCVRNLPMHGSGPPPLERTSLIVDQLGLEPSTRIALYIGFITGGRGITELIESARYLPEGVIVALLGGGRQLEEQQEFARTLGVDHKVRFLGQVPQSDVLRYAAAADCGVSLIQPTCLSYEWSLPNKIFQYIHGGLPVLCSDFPDMGDVVRRWDVGAVVDPTDSRAIADAIVRLVSDPDRLARMRANCRAAVEEELNWDRERQKILSIGFVREASARVT